MHHLNGRVGAVLEGRVGPTPDQPTVVPIALCVVLAALVTVPSVVAFAAIAIPLPILILVLVLGEPMGVLPPVPGDTVGTTIPEPPSQDRLRLVVVRGGAPTSTTTGGAESWATAGTSPVPVVPPRILLLLLLLLDTAMLSHGSRGCSRG